MDDQGFYDDLKALFEVDDHWAVVPPSHHTVDFCSLAFRTLARMGCAFEELLGSRHRLTPWQTFRLLPSPHHSDAVKELADRVRSEFPRGLVLH